MNYLYPFDHFPNNTLALRYFFPFLLLLAGLPLTAQVSAPDFQCTRSQMGAEVLTWINTPNSCGPFEATEVYTASDINGPYTLLAEVTDPTATTFEDPNPTGELRFYYLSHRYDCPGQTVENSDTLDNLIPTAPIIVYVGLEGNDIIMEWLASPSPEVSAYVILEQFPSGSVVLDTVTGDFLAYNLAVQPSDPPAEERTFLLVAIDPCGNDSPQGRVAGPMGLTGTGGFACTENISLEVDQEALSNYLPVVFLELFISIDGGAFTSVGTFSPTATTVQYQGANDGENLCFYLEAVVSADRGRAQSAIFCQTISFNQPVRDFPLYGVEVNQVGELILQFGTGGTQPVPAQASLRVTRGGGITEALDLTGFTFGSGTLVVPPLADPLEPDDEVRLRVVDDCMREVTTNAVGPVFLSGQSLFPGQNSIQWTPFINNLEGAFSYTVARAFVTDPGAVAGAVFEQIAVDINDASLSDNTGGNDNIACYQVSVRFFPEGGGPAESAIFRSNIVCILPRTEVFVPNAFSPNASQSGNLVFLPRFSSPPSAEGYSLRVFDRWGGIVFETTDPGQGWAGDARGQFLSSGTFLYQLSYETLQGDGRQKAGTINLIK